MTTEILSYIIPVVSIFLTYILGTFNAKTSDKRDVQKRRYEDFYAPYMTKLLAAFDFTDKPHTSSFGTRGAFFDQIMQNTHFLGENSAKLVPDLYKSVLYMLEYDDGNPDFNHAPKCYDDCFLAITKAILLEAKSISKELKYPNLANTILDMYDL